VVLWLNGTEKTTNTICNRDRIVYLATMWYTLTKIVGETFSMRILIVSDIHANLEALNAVLQDAGEFDFLWSLGDIVGYGPDPNACIEKLNEYDHIAIAGNHDWGVLGKIDLADFNADARLANLWTRQQLTTKSREYLDTLPETQVVGDYTLAHGSPRAPIWEYLIYSSMAKPNFGYFSTSVCLVGHTHVPIVFRDVPSSSRCQAMPLLSIFPLAIDKERYIINPGSVGQPRDANPRAAYALLDTDSNVIEHHRVVYDIAVTQQKMRVAGLPGRNIERLVIGW